MKCLIVVVEIFLTISIGMAASGIGIGITKAYNDPQILYQGNIYVQLGAVALNAKITDFENILSDTYLITPYLELAFTEPTLKMSTLYGGIAPIIYLHRGSIGFDNLYYINIGLNVSIAILAMYVETEFLMNIDGNRVQIGSIPMISIGGMLYVK